MYKIKEFADMLGVTPATLRNKDKNGLLRPSYIKPGSQYRLYSDELAYIYDKNRYILAYLSQTEDFDFVENFKRKLDGLNVKYKLFINEDKNTDFYYNHSIKELLKEASCDNTYTVLYDEKNISEKDLKIIKFYINACLSYIKIKKIEDFSLENTFKSIGDTI